MISFRRIFLLIAASFVLGSIASGQSFPVKPSEAYWDSFVVAQIKDIPNKTVRDYLINTHDNNSYGKKNEKKMDVVGVFSPTRPNVFWLPSIDVPIDSEDWRYLFLNDDIPQYLLSKISFKKSGSRYVKMILHPFSTVRPEFIELAEKFGGFKFEFQAVTTASVRSFVMWKAENSRDQIGNSLSFPENPRDIFKGKVSIYNTDIDGSRLNPAKKMVRASIVSQIFGEISAGTKNKFGFNFEREVLVGVPSGTDAGFVIREGLPEFNGSSASTDLSEPAFSVLNPKRLSKMAGHRSNPLKWITDHLFAPIAKTTTFLLFEEGMIGENHTQNFDYVVSADGLPTDKVVIRDADAYRVNLTLRAINGKSLVGAQVIDNPFHYLKEAAFVSTQDEEEGNMTINSLMDYLLDSNDETSFVSAIHSWCIDIKKFKDWCNRKTIRASLLDKMAEFASTHLHREVTRGEVKHFGYDLGRVGYISLVHEKLKQDIQAAATEDLGHYLEQSWDQKLLLDYFVQLESRGRVRYLSSVEVNLNDHFLVFYDKPGAEHLRVYRKNPRANSNPLVSIAIPDLRDELGYKKFRKDLSSCSVLLTGTEPQTPPIMKAMGGGFGVY